MLRFPNHILQLKAREKLQSTGERKSFDTWNFIFTCARLCANFSSKAINIFPYISMVVLKHILKSKACNQSNQARNKLLCHVVVKNYLSNVSWKILIKIESTWRRKIKEQAPQLTLLYRATTVGSNHRWCCVKKLFFKILQNPLEAPGLKSIFKIFSDLWTCNY